MQHLSTPPGPKDKGYIRSFFDSIAFSRKPMEHLLRYHQEYGDIVRYRLAGLTIYQINNSDYIEQVINSTDLFIRETSSPLSRKFHVVFGDGILTSEGPPWSRQRKLSEPAFNATQIASYSKTMVAYAKRMVETWPDGETSDLHHEMRRLTRDIGAKIFTGVELTDEVKEISVILDRMIIYVTSFPLPEKIPTPQGLTFRNDSKRLDEILYRIIEQRRKSGTKSTDLLGALMAAPDDGEGALNDKELRDAFVSYFVPARMNVAIALTCAWYLISVHPEVEEMIHAEVDRVLGGREPAVQDVPLLPYTTKVVMEALRLYPPIWRIARQSVQDCAIGNFHIPKGSIIFISQWVLHRHPQYFMEPERFDPSRWDTENMKSMPKFAYFPFGGGARTCIGRDISLIEVVLVLATIAQNYHLRTRPMQKLAFASGLILRPKHSIPASLTKR